MNKEKLLRLLDAMHQLCETENWCYETEQTYLQIVALIKKPQVTEEWIQEKTMEMIDIISNGEIGEAMSFIRSLVEEKK